MKKRYSHIWLLLFSCIPLSAKWTQEKGNAYLKVGRWWLEANEHYTNSGLTDPNATRGLFINSIYLRYGLGNKMSLVGYLPHITVYQNKQVFESGRTPTAGEVFSSLGDINLGIER